jgi:arabinogalactan oligomer/maltooligosaccharide transport system substrate-binding protein
MKKIIAFLMAVMMMGTVAVGCNTNSGTTNETTGNQGTTAVDSMAFEDITAAEFGEEKDATLKVWGPDAYVDLLKKQCDAFVAKFPEQNIKIEVVAQGEDTAATQMLSDSEAGADVFGFASDQLNRLVNAKVISPIKPAYAASVATTDLEESVKVSTVDGNLYAFPETGNGYYLVYDKRVVTDEQAGSLEAILDACKAAKKLFIMDAGTGYYSCVFAFTGGVKIDGLKEDKVTQNFAEYDEAEAVATLKAFSKLMHDYAGTFMSLGPENISSGFSTGKCGAGVDGSWNSSVDKEALGENLGATKLPTINVDGTDKQMISMYGYKMIGVNAASKFPRTSQILAYYLSSEECQQQRADELGWSPTNKTVVESDTVKNDVTISALVEQSAHAVAQVNVADTFWDPMANLGNKLVAEDTDPETYDFAKLLNDTIANIAAN